MVDHVNPLECGGADLPGNMQWQTVAAGKAKDKTEGTGDGYAGMAVANEQDAGLAWEVRGTLDRDEREKTRKALLDYCGLTRWLFSD